MVKTAIVGSTPETVCVEERQADIGVSGSKIFRSSSRRRTGTAQDGVSMVTGNANLVSVAPTSIRLAASVTSMDRRTKG